MPSYFRARVLDNGASRAGTVAELEYDASHENARVSSGLQLELPQGTELLWREDPAGSTQRRSAADLQKKYTEEDVKALQQQAWQHGFDEASAASRRSMESALENERAKLAASLSDFSHERDEYFHRMESEIVALALSIARRVLQRETQVDPLALTGVVRVALEKLAQGAAVKLQVPAFQAEEWQHAVSQLADLNLAIEVEADHSMTGARCVIVTQMGSTDVSVDAQLEEVERGFLDLLSHRPTPAGRTAR